MSIIFLFKIIIFELLSKLSLSEKNPEKRYISIPFIIQNPDSNLITNSLTFLQNYFSNKILFNISVGNNSQIVNGIFHQDESCFEFLDKNKYFPTENIISYSPKKSTSFNIRKETIYNTFSPNEYMALGSDFFLFDKNYKYNLSFSFFKTKNEEEINFEEIKDGQYIPKIGLSLPPQDTHLKEKCPNFFNDVKKAANLSKDLISFEFTENNKGNFIFGDELYNYDKNKYYYSQYVGSHTSQYHQFFFYKSFLIDKNNEDINITDGTYSELDYNSGVIIGHPKFQKIINTNFFDPLIIDNTCKIDNISFNNSQYFVYSCEGENFANKIKSFPKIFFESKDFEYAFELNYNDLFIKCENVYYFLIIFKENYKQNTWHFGQPFFKKFNFSMKLDEFWVGFYNPNKPIIRPEEKEPDEGKSNVIKIIIIVALVVLVIGLAVGMFFLGKKMRNERKKRANELTDDNYDYSAGIINS